MQLIIITCNRTQRAGSLKLALGLYAELPMRKEQYPGYVKYD